MRDPRRCRRHRPLERHLAAADHRRRVHPARALDLQPRRGVREAAREAEAVGMIERPPVVEDDELDAYVAVWNAITPDEPSDAERQRERRGARPASAVRPRRARRRRRRLRVRGPSQSPGPRIPLAAGAPDGAAARRRRRAARASSPRTSMRSASTPASAHVDGADDGSLAFATALRLRGGRPPGRAGAGPSAASQPAPPPRTASTFTTLAERPELLRESVRPGARGLRRSVASGAVTISLDEWLARGGDAARGLVRRARRRARSSALGPAAATRTAAVRGRAHASSAAPGGGAGSRRRSSATSSRGPPRTASTRDRHVDAAGQRGDARAERAARLRVPQRQRHRSGRCYLRGLRPGCFPPRRLLGQSSRSTSSTSSRWSST